MNRNAQIKISEPQKEEIYNDVDATSSEAEALLYKYSPEAFKENEIKKNKNKTNQKSKKPKRFNADEDYKPDGDYYDVKYSSTQLNDEEYQQELNMKIEIKSDMPL